MRGSKVRQSNFELLRIIAMYMIVLYHSCFHGNFDIQEANNIKCIIVDLLQFGGRLGVMLFVMIGSYFLVDKEFKSSRIIKILVDVSIYFYSISIPLSILKPNILNRFPLDYFLLPIPGKYWFVDQYLLLLLLSPSLNYIIKQLTEEFYRYLLFGLGVLLYVGPSFEIYEISNQNISYFIYFYFLAGYIRQYPLEWMNHEDIGKKISVISLLSIFVSIFLGHIIGSYNENYLEYTLFWTNTNSLLVLGSGLGLFIWIKNKSMPTSLLINKLASVTFGVYLIHEHPVIRSLLWSKININSMSNSSTVYFLCYVIGSSIIVFIMCIVIAYIIEGLFNRINNKVIRSISESVDCFVSKAMK